MENIDFKLELQKATREKLKMQRFSLYGDNLDSDPNLFDNDQDNELFKEF